MTLPAVRPPPRHARSRRPASSSRRYGDDAAVHCGGTELAAAAEARLRSLRAPRRHQADPGAAGHRARQRDARDRLDRHPPRDRAFTARGREAPCARRDGAPGRQPPRSHRRHARRQPLLLRSPLGSRHASCSRSTPRSSAGAVAERRRLAPLRVRARAVPDGARPRGVAGGDPHSAPAARNADRAREAVLPRAARGDRHRGPPARSQGRSPTCGSQSAPSGRGRCGRTTPSASSPAPGRLRPRPRGSGGSGGRRCRTRRRQQRLRRLQGESRLGARQRCVGRALQPA